MQLQSMEWPVRERFFKNIDGWKRDMLGMEDSLKCSVKGSKATAVSCFVRYDQVKKSI
jgi:hypothetical protein